VIRMACERGIRVHYVSSANVLTDTNILTYNIFNDMTIITMFIDRKYIYKKTGYHFHLTNYNSKVDTHRQR
jgi:hypothetical protein